MQVDTVVGDTAYSGKDNIIMSEDEANGFELVARLQPSISQGWRNDNGGFEYNKDAGMFVCPAGHMAIRKAIQGKKGNGNSRSMVYYFDIEKCKLCNRKNGCYKCGAKSKTFSMTVRSDLHQRQLDFENSEVFKSKAKVRYKIEAKNAELKQSHGYDRAKSYGIEAMRLQAAVTIFVANIKRILKLS